MQVRRLFKSLAVAALTLGLLVSPGSLRAGEVNPVVPQPCKLSSGLSSSLATGLYVSSLIL
jgi:hypothetical protein